MLAHRRKQIYKIHILLVLVTIVWPSRYSSLSAFKELIHTCHFNPASGLIMRAKLVEKQSSHTFPLTQCSDCFKILEESQLLAKVQKVKWGLLDTSTYDLETEVVSCRIACYIRAIHASVMVGDLSVNYTILCALSNRIQYCTSYQPR